MLLGRPFLNRLGAMVSTRHMKKKLPTLGGGGVIVIKPHQKVARKCYENNLKSKRGVRTIITQAHVPDETTRAEIISEGQPEPTGEVQEREIKGKRFKLGSSLGQEMKDQIVEVIARHLNAFAWTVADMPDIDSDFLCHRVTMDEKVRPVI